MCIRDSWYTVDDSDGGEVYTLHRRKGKESWTYKKSIGPFVAVVRNRCYVIETENTLWLRRVISLDAEKGDDRQVLLEMENPQWNIQFVKGERGSLFVVANNAGKQRCWMLKGSELEEVPGYTSFLPVAIQDGKASFFGRKEGSMSYEAVRCKGHFPSLISNTPEAYLPSLHYLITRRFGERTIWNTKTGKRVLTLVGNIDVDTLPSWKGKDPVITIAKPGSYREDLPTVLSGESLCPYARSRRYFTKSKDGTAIPYILVSSCKVKHLLCIVYGAYGVPTRVHTERWKPLLDRGWGLCFALVRGGGDHTDAWAEEGRRDGKPHSIEDFEACIRAAQKHFHVGASSICLYGRSAGGYTVGTTLARHASGSLFQAVYTEVPYVDVFNTTSNPDLPLTRLEYNEFGDPHRLPNAQTLLTLSPIDALPSSGAPSIFVLSRTALNDKEVFAYESVKWISRLLRLQGKNGAPKLLAVESKEGHFAPPSSSAFQRATDMALLHSWLLHNKKSKTRIYKMANTRRNNAASRKRRNNVASRKRRNNVTMGGKRRKAAGTRRRRTTHRK